MLELHLNGQIDAQMGVGRQSYRSNAIIFIIVMTSTQLQPSVALLARPTFGGLWSQNCLRGGHDIW